MVLTEDMSGLEDGRAGYEAEPGGEKGGIGMCTDESWAVNMVVAIVGSPSDAGGSEAAVDTIL